MKKVIAILMAAVMVLSFAACSKAPVTDEETSTEADVIVNDAAEETSEAVVTGSVADALATEFKAIASTGADAQTIADTLAASSAVAAIGPATMPVEPGFLNGFDNAEITGFDAGVMFAPMIGTIPFVGYVFTLSEGTDVVEFVKTLEENANLRWNICTSADEMVSAVEGNTVFFVMSPMSLEA